MEKLPKYTVLALLVVITAASVFAFSFRGQKPKGVPTVKTTTSYSPKEASADEPQETVVMAPDGKKTLTMREERGKDASTFVFLISEKGSSAQKEIYRETAPKDSITIPFNTFSPDDKYFFLKKTVGGTDTYFALSTAGTALTKESAFLEFSSLFTAKFSDYKITEATGWGGLTLVVINTEKAGGGKGPSFWFDVASHSFIQLSNRVD